MTAHRRDEISRGGAAPTKALVWAIDDRLRQRIGMHVVIAAFVKPIRRPITSTIGVIQLVVQLAQEMMDDAPVASLAP